MTLKVMPESALSDWVDRLCASYQVVGPKPRHNQYAFGPIQSAAEMDLSYPTSILPPKKYLLPPRETLLRFKDGGASIDVAKVQDEKPLVIFGVHTCDLHAIMLLDKALTEGFRDQHYAARREKVFLIGIECLKPCMDSSFCKSMGTLGITGGFDLHLTRMGDDYAIDVGTERGAQLLEGFTQARPATEADYRHINQVLSEKWPRFSYRLDFDVTELPSLLSLSQQSDVWNELGERCLSCGMCTNVCPTCYCFTMEDEVDLSLQNGERIRRWESCQSDGFAKVAGGHDFRPARAARQRHRFFRKGKYQIENFGLTGCVGCGRCAQTCPVNITPVDTFNALYHRRMARRREEVIP